MTHAIRTVDFDDLKTMTYEVTDRVARITFNRPDKGNAIVYSYKAEDNTRVDPARANERNRSAGAGRPGRANPGQAA